MSSLRIASFLQGITSPGGATQGDEPNTVGFLDGLRIAQFKRNASLRAEFYRAMADTAAQGLPQIEVLRVLRSSLPSDAPLFILVNIVEDRIRGVSNKGVSAGYRSLGSVLVGLLPDIEVSMISAGESSGEIDKGWRNAASFAVRQDQQKKAIRKALIQPVGYFAALCGLLLYFSYKLLPSFAESRPRDTWPPLAQNMGWVADHVLWIVGSIIGLIFVVIYTYRWLALNWIGPRRSSADRRLPLSLAANASGAGFMLAIASFMGAGIPFSEALSTIKTTANRYLTWQIECLEDDLHAGKRPEVGLMGCSFIPKEIHWRITLYAMASSGGMAAAYERIATDMAATAESKQMAAISTLNLLMFAVMGFSILLIFGTLAGIATAGMDI